VAGKRSVCFLRARKDVDFSLHNSLGRQASPLEAMHNTHGSSVAFGEMVTKSDGLPYLAGR
jgi:hypothetical protein